MSALLLLRQTGLVVLLAAASWSAAGEAKTLTARDRAAIEAAFAKVDTNNDGKLSRDEATAFPEFAPKFDGLDRNKDGLLSLDEFAAYEGVRSPEASRASFSLFQ
jgi:Ca2+-binding EF-hand superfamily protein